MPSRSAINQPHWLTAGVILLTLLALAGRALLSWWSPLLGDEVGTWIYMAKDVRFILTHFIDAWLTMPAFIAGTRIIYLLLGDHPFVLRLPVMLAGALAVPFMAGVIKRLGGRPSTMIIGALFMACHPYLIHYGANLRAYSCAVLATLAALYFLLGWLEKPSWSAGWGFAVSATASTLAHFNANHYLVFLAVFFLVRYLPRLAPGWTVKSVACQLRSLVVPLLCVVPVIALYYLGLLEQLLAYREVWGETPPTTVNYLPEMTGSFLGRGWWALPLLALLLGGWLTELRAAPQRALLVGLGTAIPMIMNSISGAQCYPWANTRYLIYVLPLLIISLSFTLEHLSRWRGLRPAGLMLLLACWTPQVLEEYREAQREPWRQVHAFLAGQLQPGEVVLATGHDFLHLVPGFRRQPERLVYFHDYLPGPAASSTQGLYVVTVNARLAGAPQIQDFGDISVHHYTGPNRAALAQQVVRDIQVYFDGHAQPEQVALAQSGLDLMRALPSSAPEQLAMMQVYYHSLLRSERGQYMHAHLRDLKFP